MQGEVLNDFYYNIVRCISEGKGDCRFRNPSLLFTERAKKGGYDGLSDEKYETALDNVKGISSFWNNEPEESGWNIFKNAVKASGIYSRDIRIAAEIFAGSYRMHHLKEIKNGKAMRLVVPYLDVPGLEPEELLKEDMPDDDWMDFAEEGCLDDALPVPPEVGQAACPKKADPESDDTANDVPSLAKCYADPKEIYSFLDSHIYGQDAAKMAASSFLWNHLHGRKRNMFFIGPTGCGKTEIFRQLRKIYPDIVFVDSSRLSKEGWNGDYKISSVFEGMEKEKAERSVIVMDEADKLFEPCYESHGGNVSFSIQSELLKLIEGDPVAVRKQKEYVELDTKNISFVFLGSFERLIQAKSHAKGKGIGFGAEPEKHDTGAPYEAVYTPEDLVEYAGVRREIAGRACTIVQLQAMTAEDYLHILDSRKVSPIDVLSGQYGVSITASHVLKEELACEAVDSGMGVRFLNSRLQALIDKEMFEDCSRKSYELG